MTDRRPSPLLLVHGFAQTVKSWQKTIDELRVRVPDRSVHAIELPGHGATGLSMGEPTVVSVREFVGESLDRIGAAKAVMWGYSQGARVALDYALADPERVAGLILESGVAGIEDPVARADRRSRDAALASRVEQSTVERFVALWESVPALSDQSRELIEAQRADRLSQDPPALAAALRGIGQSAYEPMWDRLAELRSPVLTISGERDRVYTAHARRIAESVDDGRHVEIADAGHSVHLEQPINAVVAVAEFLTKLA